MQRPWFNTVKFTSFPAKLFDEKVAIYPGQSFWAKLLPKCHAQAACDQQRLCPSVRPSTPRGTSKLLVTWNIRICSSHWSCYSWQDFEAWIYEPKSKKKKQTTSPERPSSPLVQGLYRNISFMRNWGSSGNPLGFRKSIICYDRTFNALHGVFACSDKHSHLSIICSKFYPLHQQNWD